MPLSVWCELRVFHLVEQYLLLLTARDGFLKPVNNRTPSGPEVREVIVTVQLDVRKVRHSIQRPTVSIEIELRVNEPESLTARHTFPLLCEVLALQGELAVDLALAHSIQSLILQYDSLLLL